MHNRYTSTLPAWWGFSFALHLLRVRGFSFALLQYNPIQAFTAAFMPFMQLYRPRHKTAHKDLQGLFRLFPVAVLWLCILLYCTACTTPEHITAPQQLQRIPDTSRHAGRCTGQHRPPIIIRYIRGAQIMPARRGQLLPCVDRWQVLHPAHLLRGQRLHLYRVSPAVCCPALMDREQTQQRAGGTIDGYRRISFRAFAR